ncbi:MAG: hypothetical protein R2838_13960 [Caldilineaceae bacterium]
MSKRKDVDVVAFCDVRPGVGMIHARRAPRPSPAWTPWSRTRRWIYVAATPDHLHREPSLAAINAGA